MITNANVLEFAGMILTIASVGIGTVLYAARASESQERRQRVPRPDPLRLETPRKGRPCITSHPAGSRCPYCEKRSRRATDGH